MSSASSVSRHAAPFHVETRIDQGRAVAEITGEVDIFAWQRLSAALAEIQARAIQPALVLVLTGLAFIDSSGLGALVSAMRRARQAGGAVALVETPEHLLRVLRITALETLLPSFPTVEAAVAFLASGPGAR